MLILCDAQELFRSRIPKISTLINSSRFLIQSSAKLDIPFVLSQHYTSAFGGTLSELKETADEAYKSKYFNIEKRQFSLVTKELEQYLSTEKERRNIILMGLETHICILNTTLDFLRQGYHVHVVSDAVFSQRDYDREVALQRMNQSGAIVTTAESIAYELMDTSLHPQFKSVLGFVKERSKGSMFD